MGANAWRDEPAVAARARRADAVLLCTATAGANTRDGNGSTEREQAGATSAPIASSTIHGTRCRPDSAAATRERRRDQREVERRRDVLVYSTHAARRATRSHRADRGPLVGRVVGDRHGLHGEARRRFPRRHGTDADRRHPARTLSARQDVTRAADAGAAGGTDHRRRRDEQSVRRRPPHSRRDLEQQLSRASIATRTPAGPFGESAELRRAEQTIFHDPQHPSRIVLPIVPQ